MKMFKKRYAVIGWLTLMVGKMYARRKMRRVGRRRFAR
jgi:hypothetical protein